jgi:hypothetical protein
MPIYEYYCRDNHKIYQFYAKTLAQGRIVPKCPDGPGLRMEKLVSAFSVVGKTRKAPVEGASPPDLADAEGDGGPDDARLNSAMAAMEGEMANLDENDPRAMGRMMRRMAELSGEKIGGEMEEVVRKLEEGADPESLEEQMGGDDAAAGADPYGEGSEATPAPEAKESRHHFRARRGPPARDPKLYDYE